MAWPNTPGGQDQSIQQSLFGDEPAPPAADASAFRGCRVHRIRPPVKAHGGKYYLAPKIVPILFNVRAKVTEYLEPCAFGASVFLAMPRMKREILGDINPDVVALWTVLSQKESATELSQRLANVPYTAESFEAAKRETSGTMIEQATRFLIRCRFSRGGLGKDFAWSERQRGGRPGDENAWHTFRENELPKIIARAGGGEVLSDPCWKTVWQSRTKVQRLIYADPPYMPKTRTAKTAYGPFEMTPFQHLRLITGLRAHAGPAAISGYRCDEYDRWLEQLDCSLIHGHAVARGMRLDHLFPGELGVENGVDHAMPPFGACPSARRHVANAINRFAGGLSRRRATCGGNPPFSSRSSSDPAYSSTSSQSWSA